MWYRYRNLIPNGLDKEDAPSFICERLIVIENAYNYRNGVELFYLSKFNYFIQLIPILNSEQIMNAFHEYTNEWSILRFKTNT